MRTKSPSTHTLFGARVNRPFDGPAMRVELPNSVGASIPFDYVAFIGDDDVARIEDIEELLAGHLEIANADGTFVWKSAGHALHVNSESISHGVVTYRTFLGKRFLCFTLLFGREPTPSGGPALLTSCSQLASWFRDFAAKVAPMIPGGVVNELDKIE